MLKPSKPKNEVQRLRALEDLHILDTPEETLYDAFTNLAAELAGTSIAAISLIDDDRQWFKSHHGLAVRETARDISFCGHVVEGGRALIVQDTHLDDRFVDNPLVTGDPSLRFYAGMPLTTPEGYTIGTLCVMDREPHRLTATQTAALESVAKALMAALDSRRRFLRLFDSAHVDLFAIDPNEKTIIFGSRGACERLGYTEREIIGMPIFDVIPALLNETLDDAIAQIRSGTPIVRDAQLRRRDGSSYPVELRADLSREEGQERIVAIAIDQTERQSARREVDLLLRAINVAGDVIVVYKAEPNAGLRLEYMNDAFTARTGFSRDEAIGRSLNSFRTSMPDDDGMRKVRAALKEGTPTEAELISYRKDGSTYWNQVSLYPILDSQGAITHWVSIERDITEDVERTAALEEEHDRLLALTRSARRIFTALDPRALISTLRQIIGELLGIESRVLAVADDGRCAEVEELGQIEASPGTRDALIDEAVERRVRVLSTRRDRAVAYAGRFGDAQYVLDLRVPAGRQLRSTDAFVIDLLAEYFAVAARNVNVYNELDERRSAVLELSQTKSDLIAMLAHDFRGPLTSIVGFADLTGEVGEVTAEQRDFLSTIKDSAMQLSELATDTLTLSLLERNEVTLRLEQVKLEDLLRSIVAQYSDRREVRLSTIGDATVLGDDERLRQVFSNLVENAIKYSPNGTVPEVLIDGTGDPVIIRIRDTGIGIPAAEVASVFERFSRASNAREMHISGTGFGLFLTKQLIALHGGVIELESTLGKGSTFTVRLPRQVPRGSAPRTIVVLDPEQDRSFLAYGLREAGYRISTVRSVEEFFSTADLQHLDALLVNMPLLTGEHVVQLRTFARKRAIPIVAVSDEATPLLGASETMMRPVLAADVLATFDRVFARGSTV
ncbi:MAG: PAS domain S-box protein [Vulcanimicrobiaceae bacterium]